MDGEMDIEQLTTMIEKISTVSGADIRGVLYSLVDVAVQQMDQGRIVRLGDLGSLRVSLSSEGYPTEEEINAGSIKKMRIIFTPGTKIKDMMKTVRFTKASVPAR
jgi:predicted histone-like DNA-binding protein